MRWVSRSAYHWDVRQAHPPASYCSNDAAGRQVWWRHWTPPWRHCSQCQLHVVELRVVAAGHCQLQQPSCLTHVPHRPLAQASSDHYYHHHQRHWRARRSGSRQQRQPTAWSAAAAAAEAATDDDDDDDGGLEIDRAHSHLHKTLRSVYILL